MDLFQSIVERLAMRAGTNALISHVGQGHTESFLERARRLDQQGRVSAALDLIYDSVDELLRRGEFSRLNLILAMLRPTAYSVDLLLGVLTATLPAKTRLTSRNNFFTAVEQTLKERGEFEPTLLMGLEG